MSAKHLFADKGQRKAKAPTIFPKTVGPVVAGTGFVALDVVVTDREGGHPSCWAGGTCGNVLAILAYFGWRSYPMASLGDDAAGDHVVDDLKHCGVNTRFLSLSEERHTPIVVEKIRTLGVSHPRHRFVWTCPTCGAWLPGYRPLLAEEARKIAAAMPAPRVFFFDRLSRGALELAEACAKSGALIVFEPSGLGDEKLFNEAVALAHILKYSNERLGHMRRKWKDATPALEIETMGGEGLRYRRKKPESSGWLELPPNQVTTLRDTAGAGDWCTAGILHGLGAIGSRGLATAGTDTIETALRLGQALAAIKCGYEGARGVMYALSRKQIQAALTIMLKENLPLSTEKHVEDRDLSKLLKSICPSCDNHGRKRHSA
jgi:fructokinase